MPKIKVVCDNCGQGMMKYPSRVTTHNFCNRQCYLEFHKTSLTPVKCQHCGGEWQPRNISNANKYCSRECYDAVHNIKNKLRKCPTCEEFFEAKTSEDKYCSWDCYNEDRHMPTGEDHWNWQGGISPPSRGPQAKQWRLKVYARDQYTCQKCGSKEDLRAHHIYAWFFYESLRYEIDNGITLCEECHKQVHKTFGYYSREEMLLQRL